MPAPHLFSPFFAANIVEIFERCGPVEKSLVLGLAVFSVIIARIKKKSALASVIEHLGIAIGVMVLSKYVGGFITKKKDDAVYAFTEDQAKELGSVMLKFLEYALDGKLTNSPVKNK